jgi:hypothetical protein
MTAKARKGINHGRHIVVVCSCQGQGGALGGSVGEALTRIAATQQQQQLPPFGDCCWGAEGTLLLRRPYLNVFTGRS